MASVFMKELAEIYRVAIESVKPSKLMQSRLKLFEEKLIIKQNNRKDDLIVDLKGCNIHVIGGGKSVLDMAKGLAEVVNCSSIPMRGSFSHGCLSVPIGLKDKFTNESQSLLESIETKVFFGSRNNLPDEGSLKASSSIQRLISEASIFDKLNNKRSLFIVLISGGGSACLTSPKHINLETKLKMIKFLAQRGADIVELNKVRRFFSKIKGGQLAKFILRNKPDARVVTLAISDVICDPLEYIASGPTFISNANADQHRRDMLEVLEKYNYQFTEDFRDETDDISIGPDSVANVIIGNNSLALEAVVKEAQKFHYNVECIGDKLSGSTEEIVAKLTRYGDEKFAKEKCRKLLVVGGGEATISKAENDSWGLGGRTQEMALDYMIGKLSRGENNCPPNEIDVLLSASTDGQDGPTDVAGCFASLSDWSRLKTFDLTQAREAKSCHDSYNFWTKTKPNWLLKSGLTGTNVMDLYMYCLW